MNLLKTLLSRYVKLDRPARSLSIADKVFEVAGPGLGKRLAPEAEITVQGKPGGLFVTAKVGGKPVSALLTLQSIAFKDGSGEVVLGTPEGLTVEGRQIAGRFAEFWLRMLGLNRRTGSALGVPTEAVWEKGQARLKFDLAGDGEATSELRTLRAKAVANRTDGWTTLTLDDDRPLDRLWSAILQLVKDLLLK